MAGKTVVRLLCLGGLLVVLLAGCAPRRYTPEDLIWLRAKSIEGVVAKQSRGSFVLQEEAGQETTFRTGEMTQYIPEGYRSQQGDKVEVIYQEVQENPARVKLVVLQLKALTVAEQNKELANPIAGEFLGLGRGSMQYYRSFFLKIPQSSDPLHLYLVASTPIEWDGKTWTADSLPAQTWEDAAGYPIEVTARRLPILRGNAYIYEAVRIVLPNLRL